MLYILPPLQFSETGTLGRGVCGSQCLTDRVAKLNILLWKPTFPSFLGVINPYIGDVKLSFFIFSWF